MNLRLSVLALSLSGLLFACGGGDAPAEATSASGSGSGSTASTEPALNSGSGEKVLHLPMRSAGPGSLDPVMGSTVYDNRGTSFMYETLLQYKYLKRPQELEPLLLTEMPIESERNGLKVYTFKLKHGVLFHDDACFPGGKGREMTARDVEYSWKRLADPANELKSWWILEDMILGLNEYKETQAAAGSCDYDVSVEGLKVVDNYTLEVTLAQPLYSFLWKTAMFQMSIVPREAVEKYGPQFAIHPVGTGPFVLAKNGWEKEKSLLYLKNPTYRDEFYPAEHMPEDEALGLHLPAGKKIPFVDRVEVTMFVKENPMWLEFKAGSLDYTQVPAENYLEAFEKRSRRLKKTFRDKGVVDHKVPLLDFIFRSFNMMDEVVGGYTPEKIALRKAISLATDLEEFNDAFYNGENIVYDGMIPPVLDGYPTDGRGPVSYSGPDLEEARRQLVLAGYPGGKGLPVIDYYIGASGNIPEQAEMWKRQLEKIGVNLNVRSQNFAQLIDAINSRKATIFSFAWSSDYPDGENNLALFYWPNRAPRSNHGNYNRPEFDAMYEQCRLMSPSPERTALYEKMRDSVLEDVPFVGSMARTRFYMINPWLKNFKPSEDFYNWVKYMDVEGRP